MVCLHSPHQNVGTGVSGPVMEGILSTVGPALCPELPGEVPATQDHRLGEAA